MAGSGPLAQVREGMDVFDSSGNKLGTVRDVFLGTSSGEAEAYTSESATAPDPDLYDNDSILENLAEAFDDDDMPDELRERLLYHGYIRIDTGLLRDDRYAEAGQVMRVTEEGVFLGAREDERLAKG